MSGMNTLSDFLFPFLITIERTPSPKWFESPEDVARIRILRGLGYVNAAFKKAHRSHDGLTPEAALVTAILPKGQSMIAMQKGRA
jgi:hypothetical protein